MISVVLVLGCQGSPPEPARPLADPAEVGGSEAVEPEIRRRAGLDVLLVTIDTLRRDALGAYGNARVATPWIDRLAAEGVRFERAYAHSVVTLPSHASLLSGLYPQEHGVRDNSGFRFPPELDTLATILARRGYRTGAFVSAFPVDSRFGLDRGFDVYEDSFVGAGSRSAFLIQERPGAVTVELARRWVEASLGSPSFCWVHLYEPHFPYEPPEGLAERFSDAPYLGEVATADAALAPLLEPLLEGRGDPTLVVLTSDHGEALGEHGEATHGIFAYEETLAVPLILHQEELFEPAVVAATARLVDLVPTVLDVLAIDVPAGLRGRSLLPAIAGRGSAAPVSSYFEALSGHFNRGWAPLYGVLRDDLKFIELPIPELYDLATDPAEERNLAPSEPERVAEMRRLLEPLRSLDPGLDPAAESAEVRARLESLGYASAPRPRPRRYGEGDDPKHLIASDAELREVVRLYSVGEVDAALRLSRELVAEQPRMRIAWLDLAHLERAAGNLEAGIRALERALALGPEDTSTLALLATFLTQAERAPEAVELTAPHMRFSQPDPDVGLVRALAQARLGRFEEALATLDAVEAVDPGLAMVEVHRGTVHLISGRREAARAAYEAALDRAPNSIAALTALAVMATEDGRIDTAVAYWRRAGAADARTFGRLVALAGRLWESGNRRSARPLFELFVEAAPRSSYDRQIEQVRRLLASGS